MYKKTIKAANIVLVLLTGLLMSAPVILSLAGSFVSEELIQTCFSGLFAYDVSWSVPGLKDILSNLSMQQYKTVLIHSPDYLFRLWRSLYLTVPVVMFRLILYIPAAYGFSRSGSKKTAILFGVYMFFVLLPRQITVIPNYIAAKALEIADTDWSVWLFEIASPGSLYLLTRSMEKIPEELIDAAGIDGAGDRHVLSRIVIPVCKGQITVCAVLLFAECWSMVELPLVMFSDELRYPLSVFLAKIQREDIGPAFAASAVYMIPVLLVYVFGEDYMITDTDNMEISREVRKI